MKLLPRLWLLAAMVGVRLAAAAPDEVLIFTYFVGNGEDGLHLATSEDGLKWTAVKGGASLLTPVVGENKLMRDPCLLRGPDGVFRLVWTTSWTGVTIGYASSRDLMTWSEQKALPVMAHEPTTANCWAPEIVWDEAKGRYLIFWSSTVPGRFPVPDETERKDKGKPPRNHRLYATTTKEFVTFSPTQVQYEPGLNVIDETMVRDAVKGDWVMVVKNETEIPTPAKNLYLVRGKSPDGPWTPPSAPFSPAGVWVEGATVIQREGWWWVYFDKYRDKKYGVMRTQDWQTWEDRSADLVMPTGIRHGTVLSVPRTLVDALNAAK
jgi:hypothetical protein